MGKITNIKTSSEGKVTITLDITEKELMFLKGNMEKMHLFSENNLNSETRMVQRGKRDSTKYILLPKEFREGIMISDIVKCSMIETNTKKILMFSANKY